MPDALIFPVGSSRIFPTEKTFIASIPSLHRGVEPLQASAQIAIADRFTAAAGGSSNPAFRSTSSQLWLITSSCRPLSGLDACPAKLLLTFSTVGPLGEAVVFALGVFLGTGGVTALLVGVFLGGTLFSGGFSELRFCPRGVRLP